MSNLELKPDGTFVYYDSDGNTLLSVKDSPIYDADTSEIVGYETISAKPAENESYFGDSML